MSEDESHLPRFCFPVSELLFGAAFLSFLAAFEIPIINTARELQGMPPVLPWLTWLLDIDERVFGLAPETSILAAPVLATVAILLRKVLPESIRKYFPLTNSKRRRKSNSST